MPAKEVKDFYDSSSFLLIGMSKSRNNFGWAIYKGFTGAGKKVLPLHPEGGEKDGVEFCSNIEDFPEIPEACIISADLKNDDKIISELANAGVKRFWFQWGSYDKNRLSRLREQNDIVAIHGCVFMYLPESGFPHNLHRFLHELFTKGDS